MNPFENLETGGEESLFLENLSALECLAILKESSRRKYKIERIGCWTREKNYFKIHDYDRFCDDYLIDLDGWELQAYKQLMITYDEEISNSDPNNLPLFELEITRSWNHPERAKLIAEAVKTLRAAPTYTPKDFNAYDAPIEICLD